MRSLSGWLSHFGAAEKGQDHVPRLGNSPLVEVGVGAHQAIALPCSERCRVKTILVLEDESSLMGLLRHMLNQHHIIEATTAEEALRLFKFHGRQVDLLLADVTLPTSSGVQVALLLRTELPDLPVLLTSGYPVNDWSNRDSADLKRLGARSVTILEKPFHAQILLRTVRELIGEAVRTA